MSESFAELFEQSYVEAKMQPGTIMSATVVEIDTNTVVVNAGLKSESFIPIEQFYDKEGKIEVNIGDTVDVALDAIEDGFGETLLSREKAKQLIAWARLEEAHKEGETVTGAIVERIKGGYSVNIDCIRAFLPRSLIDVRPVKDTSYLEDIPLELKVIKIDRQRNNIVVSRRAVMEIEGTAEHKQLLEELKEGMLIKGIVKNLTDYGAFLDLGGVDGLLHITDMAWKRVKSPDEIVKIGDEIEVKVLKFDRERSRISLGLKQTGEDPWTSLKERYLNKRPVSGKVTNIADYGCFVELEEGVEGLVHVSEMDWTNKNIHPSKLIHIGDTVDVVIIDVDEERRRISMSMKQCKSNPWTEFAAGYKRDDRITGTIKSITDFGIFVGLENDIDGLIHLSDIAWSGYDEECLRQYKKGQEIETVILSIDAERERISLGVKQLEEDPFSSYIAKHAKGAVVTGIVSTVGPKMIVVKLEDQIEGLLRASELSLEKKIEDARNEVKEGDELKLKITAIDRKKRTINVSVRAQAWDEEQEAIREYAPDAASGAKLGDILKNHLE